MSNAIAKQFFQDKVSSLYVRIKWSSQLSTRTVTQPDIEELLIQLFQILFSGICRPTPQQATKYVNSRRFWRRNRISREVRRQLHAINKSYDPIVVENTVQCILHDCEICSVDDMIKYYEYIDSIS